MSALRLILICLLISQTAYGTEVVLIASKSGVILGADSLRLHGTGAPPTLACKIHQTKNVFWSAAGTTGDTNSGFDIANFFKSGIQPDQSVEKNLADIGKSLIKPLEREMPLVKIENPEYYANSTKGDKIVLSLYATQTNGSAIASSEEDFKFENGRITPIPEKPCDALTGVCLYYTKSPAVTQLLDTLQKESLNAPQPIGVDPIAFMNRLMEAGHSSEPGRIGPPYSILEITPQSANWIKQNDCEDIDQSITTQRPTKIR